MKPFLGVQPGEGRGAFLMTAHSFAMGCSTVFFETAASALFLSQFSPRTLPYVYIVAAIVTTVTGLAYSRIRQHSSFNALMAGTLLFLLVSVSAFRTALWLTDAAWLAFALLVWYRVLSILTDLQYWAVAARLYNVRQAKRLFGLIGSGEVVARIAGAFAVPLLVTRIGVANLILLSAIGLAASLLVLVPVLGELRREGRHTRRARRDPQPQMSQWEHFRVLLGSRYLRLVLALAALAVLGKYFVDYAFLEQMRSRYSDVTRLAGFFGLFSGVTQVISLLTRALLSGWLLSRFGIQVGLMVMPAVHVVCTIAIVGAAFGADSSTLVFWLVITNQGIYKTLKHPIDNPSFKVLYQPLRSEQRLSAQIAVEAIVTPVTIGLAGVVMIVFGVLIPFDAVQFAFVMLVGFGVWLVVARLASREYSGALVQALSSRLVDHAQISLSDEPSLAIIKEKLKSTDDGDVIFALDLLDRVEYKGLHTLLLQRLEHPSPAVRRFVLESLESHRMVEAQPDVARRVERESDLLVREAAVRCLAALEKPTAGSQVTPYLDHAAPEVRRGAMTGLLKYRDGVGANRALRLLGAAATSDSAADRALAAQVMASVDRPEIDLPLAPLLRDPSPEVRRVALAAAARVRTPTVCAELLENLSSPTFGAAAASALTAFGPDAVEVLAPRFQAGEKRLLLYRIAEILGRIPDPRGIALLQASLGIADESVRLQVHESLARCNWRAEGAAIELVRAEIRDEAADAAWNLAALREIGADAELAPLRAAMVAEVVANRHRMLVLLSFLVDPAAVLAARENIGHEQKDRRAYALEILDLNMPPDLKPIMLPVLEEASTAALAAAAVAVPPAVRDERLRQMVRRPLKWMKPWTRACAIHAGVALRVQGWAEVVETITDPDPLVRETAEWAAGGGAATATAGGHRMLTVEKVMILKAVQMFSRTPEEVLADVASIVEEVELRKGEVIFEKGDPGDSMYIIVSGEVRVYDGDRTINRLGRRDIFGELALLDPEPRSASIAAIADTRLFRIDRETFSELMAGNISIVRGILHVLCDRLRRVIPVTVEPGGGEDGVSR